MRDTPTGVSPPVATPPGLSARGEHQPEPGRGEGAATGDCTYAHHGFARDCMAAQLLNGRLRRQVTCQCSAACQAMQKKSVQFGKHCMCEFGPLGSGATLQPLTSSAELLQNQDWVGLRANMQRDGYLYLPGALPRTDVEVARTHVLQTFERKGDILDPTRPMSEGTLRERCGMGCVPFMEGRNAITHSAELLKEPSSLLATSQC